MSLLSFGLVLALLVLSLAVAVLPTSLPPAIIGYKSSSISLAGVGLIGQESPAESVRFPSSQDQRLQISEISACQEVYGESQ